MTSSLVVLVLVVMHVISVCGESTSNYPCPAKCRCRRALQQTSVVVDCSNRGLTDVPRDLDPASVHLDLSGNEIQVLSKGSFDGLGSMATILLNDNNIREIHAHAFRGLGNIRTLDLSRNHVTELLADSLAGIHGAMECSSSNPCFINLQSNPLRRLRSYALSWCKGVSFLLGNASTPLEIEPYAFYGAEDIPQIQITSVPSVHLQPRLFTNTDSVEIIEITKSTIRSLKSFTFEGLTNVAEIHFNKCEFGEIEEFGFAGMVYLPSARSQATAYTTTHQKAGGVLNISGSTLPLLPPDGFRDTNLGRLTLDNNTITVLRGNAFRGLHGLQLLEVTRNTIDRVSENAFSSLKGVPHVLLSENKITNFSGHAFRDSKGIKKLSLHGRKNAILRLPAFSFSGLRDVGILDIRGGPGAVLHVDKDAFQNLGDVHTLQISNVSLPTVGQHTFRGLSKIQVLRLEYCNISRIDNAAFGINSGSVTALELAAGNNLPCDCQTNSLLRHLETRFSRFTISCTSETSRRILTPDTLNWPQCDTTSISSGCHISPSFSILVLSLTHLLMHR